MANQTIKLIRILLNVISWVFSILFLLLSITIITIIKGSLLSAIFSLALGLFLLPPLASLLKDKFGFAPSKKVKTSIIVGLLLFFSFSAADPTESQDT